MKDSYFQKMVGRIKQRARLLIARPDLQEEILGLRKKWNIPEDGIRTEEENRKWNGNLNNMTTKYFDNEWKKHRDELIKLRGTGRLSVYKNKEKELNNAAPLNAFRLDIKSLIKKYKLGARWEYGIKRYLLFNDINNMSLSIGVTIAEHLDDELEAYQLCLHIEEDTTLEDIKEIWPYVKEHQKRLSSYQKSKFHPIPNLQRDKRAYELQMEGKSLEEIEDIIQVEFGDALDYNQLNIVIKRYMKRLNIS